MSKPINVRITDELEAKINKAVEEEKTTVTELTRKAIAEYDSLTEIHQILLNNYNSCDYIDKLNRKDLGENIEHTIRDVSNVLINISRVKRTKNKDI